MTERKQDDCVSELLFHCERAASDGTSSEDRAESNRYIAAVKESERGWRVAPVLVRHEHTLLQTLGARLIAERVESGWSRLQRKQLSALPGALLQLLTLPHVTAATQAVLARALAVVFVKAVFAADDDELFPRQHVERLKSGLFSLRRGASALRNRAGSGSLSGLLQCLAHMTRLYKSLPLSRSHRAAATAHLKSLSTQTLLTVAAALHVAVPSLDATPASVLGVSGAALPDDSVQNEALDCLKCWLSHLVLLPPPFADLLLRAFDQLRKPATFTAAAELLLTAIKHETHHLPTCIEYIAGVTALAPLFRQACTRARVDVAFSRGTVRLAAACGEKYVRQIVAGEIDPALGDRLLALLVNCYRHSDVDTALLTRDFWCLAAFHVHRAANVDDYRPHFVALLDHTLHHVAVPAAAPAELNASWDVDAFTDAWTAVLEDEPDLANWALLRTGRLWIDFVSSAHLVLGSQAFWQRLAAAWSAAGAAGNWRTLEAVMLVGQWPLLHFRSRTRPITTTNNNNNNNNNNDDTGADNSERLFVTTVCRLLVQSMSVARRNPLLSRAALGLLGSAGEFLHACAPQLIGRVLKFVADTAVQPLLCRAGCRALRQLAAGCPSELLPRRYLPALVSHARSRLLPALAAVCAQHASLCRDCCKAAEHVHRALVRLAVRAERLLPGCGAAARVVQLLTRCALRALSGLLARATPAAQLQLHGQLSAMTCVYAELLCQGGALVLPSLRLLWPAVEQLASSRWRDSADLVDAVMRLFCAVWQSAGRSALPCFAQMFRVVLHCYQASASPLCLKALRVAARHLHAAADPPDRWQQLTNKLVAFTLVHVSRGCQGPPPASLLRQHAALLKQLFRYLDQVASNAWPSLTALPPRTLPLLLSLAGRCVQLAVPPLAKAALQLLLELFDQAKTHPDCAALLAQQGPALIKAVLAAALSPVDPACLDLVVDLLEAAVRLQPDSDVRAFIWRHSRDHILEPANAKLNEYIQSCAA